MKNPASQSATSLPRAPRDDAHGRMTKYFTMMAIRVACFVLMVVITPYGWYTWLFAIGACFLPYVAVVVANVATAPAQRAVPPERAIESSAPTAPTATETGVIRIQESGSRRTPPPSSPDPS
ncbi:DUF3099 domain-containing protein [Microbacterium sp.]|uniref:DUF3099 domain-containing protein n=1 Tax=Microbacterium sp. TaxID=51671 RepID=UPI003C723993